MTTKELLEKTRSFLGFRQQSYQEVFNQESRFAREVLTDLIDFCRGTKTTFHPDPRVHALMEGRREVLLRICDHLKLHPDELLEKYK